MSQIVDKINPQLYDYIISSVEEFEDIVTKKAKASIFLLPGTYNFYLENSPAFIPLEEPYDIKIYSNGRAEVYLNIELNNKGEFSFFGIILKDCYISEFSTVNISIYNSVSYDGGINGIFKDFCNNKIINEAYLSIIGFKNGKVCNNVIEQIINDLTIDHVSNSIISNNLISVSPKDGRDIIIQRGVHDGKIFDSIFCNNIISTNSIGSNLVSSYNNNIYGNSFFFYSDFRLLKGVNSPYNNFFHDNIFNYAIYVNNSRGKEVFKNNIALNSDIFFTNPININSINEGNIGMTAIEDPDVPI